MQEVRSRIHDVPSHEEEVCGLSGGFRRRVEEAGIGQAEIDQGTNNREAPINGNDQRSRKPRAPVSSRMGVRLLGLPPKFMKNVVFALIWMGAVAAASGDDVHQIRRIDQSDENPVKIFKFQDVGNDCYLATKRDFSPSISCVKR